MPVWKADGVCVCFEFGWRWCEDIRFFSSLHSAGEIFLVCYRTTRAWCAYRRINALAKAVRWLTKRRRAHTKFYAMHCSLLSLPTHSIQPLLQNSSHANPIFMNFFLSILSLSSMNDMMYIKNVCWSVIFLILTEFYWICYLMYKYSTASFISWVGLLYVNLQKITLSG